MLFNTNLLDEGLQGGSLAQGVAQQPGNQVAGHHGLATLGICAAKNKRFF